MNNENEHIEPLQILAELIVEDAHRLRAEYRANIGAYHSEDLVWYMPQLFIRALIKSYYRQMADMTTIPNPPQLMGIKIREGYEPRVVLACTMDTAFTRPELTLRGKDLTKKQETAN